MLAGDRWAMGHDEFYGPANGKGSDGNRLSMSTTQQHWIRHNEGLVAA